MIRRLRNLWVGGLLLSLVVATGDVWAFQTPTHNRLNRRSADVSTLGRDDYLREQLGFSDGLAERFSKLVSPLDAKEVRDWIGRGGEAEDEFRESERLGALNRSRHHFHNPLLGWDRAGLSGRCFLLPVGGVASVRWAQSLEEQAGGSARWSDARNRFKDALTLSSKAERDDAWANLFQILGQQMHLVADLAVPAHTRNDIHCTSDDEPFEVWAARRANLDSISGVEPIGPSTAIFDLGLPAGESVATIPVARLWDSDLYIGSNPTATLLPLIGLSEYSNANFFSKDTVFSPNFPFPARTSVDPDVIFFDPKTGKLRRYLAKRRDGDSIERLAVSSALDEFLPQDLKSKNVGFDDAVHAEYASKLFPRAVGYSAALLDYFFRGKLDVTVQAGIDPQVPELMQLVGKNASSEPLGGGTLTVYADDLSGNRQPVAGPILLGTVSPGADLPTITFTPPFPPERFVAVYQGTLGNEAGAVIGKVRGGLRAESIFPDGTQRKLRAVEGVFPLPPTVDGLEAIQWGDLDNTFVGLASSTPGAGAPDQVGVFTVNRPTGSTMVPLAGGMVDASPLKALDFPFGLTLPTTLDYGLVHLGGGVLTIVEIKQTNVFKVTDPETGAGGYEPQPLVVTVSSESAPAGVIDFNQRVPIVLDRVHLLNPDTDPGPYTWRVVEVGLDAQQRPLALVEVQLTRTPGPLEEFLTVVQIDEVGNRIVAPLLPIQGRFPIDSLLMALIDLERGEVLGVTSEPLVSIRRVELHATGGFYYHTVIEFVGGDNPPPKYDRWGISSPFNAPPLFANDFPFVELGLVNEGSFGVQTLTLDGWYRGDLNPLVGPTIQSSSTTIESLGIVAVDSVAKVNYLLPERSTHFSVENYFTFIRQGMRMRPTPTGSTPEVLLLFGTPVGVIIGEGEEAKLVRWSPQVAANTQLAFPEELPVSNYTIEFATPRGALVRAEDTLGRLTTLLFDFPTNRQTPFVDQDLAQQYVLLAPEFLYNLVDTQFHTVDASLRRTALPAPLAEAPPIPAPAAAYHLIRLP